MDKEYASEVDRLAGNLVGLPALKADRDALWGVLNSVRCGLKWNKFADLKKLMPRIEEVLAQSQYQDELAEELASEARQQFVLNELVGMEVAP